MDVSFNELKILVTVVADDLLKDDFDNLLDGLDILLDSKSDVSDEIYDKIYLLSCLLDELYKHRPLPF